VARGATVAQGCGRAVQTARGASRVARGREHAALAARGAAEAALGADRRAGPLACMHDAPGGRRGHDAPGSQREARFFFFFHDFVMN
jgi:hypothetical protein